MKDKPRTTTAKEKQQQRKNTPWVKQSHCKCNKHKDNLYPEI